MSESAPLTQPQYTAPSVVTAAPGFAPQYQPVYPPSGPAYSGSVPQPQYVLQPGYQAVPATVLVQPVRYGPIPQPLICQYCHFDGVSQTRPKTGIMTWIAMGGLCLVGCWPCVWIPLVVDALKDVEHVCPQCAQVVGIYQRVN
eukprot:EC714628.1.p2 GENE.EC714628.1~~EC714628.1.p2  ORF type:complete len:143 (+),score=15.08 EC714628.1:59-487(+)